jgi:NitT/TauT family transport system substrate-binding protein
VKNKILKTLIGIIIILILFISIIKLNKKEDTGDLKTIRLAEVTHSVFYAPLYVAIEQGYFKDNGINIELILTSGADKVSASVLSNDVEIGFAGPESAIYIYEGGEEDYLITFSGLTKRDGQFIVSRTKIDNFTLEDLKGKEVLAGRLGGMPELNFVNALENENINATDVNINTSVEFASLSGSFIAGMGDFVNLFEPNATNLVKEGYGYIVGNIGSLSGEMPYTAFYARKSYIENNEEIIKSFTNAINEGLKFVSEKDSEEIASSIINQFPDITLNDLTTIIDNYKQADSWLENSYISEESYKNLEKIMINNNLIDDYVPYNKLVKNFVNE